MRHRHFCLSIAGALTLALAGAASAQAPAPQPMAIKQVKPELYLVTGGGGNVSVRVTPDGLVIVDTKNNGQAFYDDLMARIRTVSDKPVKFAIDTHTHADHTGNNARFSAAGARVVGHKNLPVEIDRLPVPPGAANFQRPGKPDVTYDSSFDVKLGGKTVQLHHYAPAHTGADTVVYFPDLKVVAFGDELVTGRAPNIDYAGGGSVAGWLRSYDAALKLDWDTAIAGHGDDPVGRAEVQAFRAKLAQLLDRAKAAVKGGATKETFIAAVKPTEIWPFADGFWNEVRTNGLWAEAGGK